MSKASYLNGILKTSETYEPFASATYEGTNSLASARWTRSESDFFGRTISESRPGFGGTTLVTSNIYNSAGQLTRRITVANGAVLASSIFCYNSSGQRCMSVEDMNRNNQIDWSDTDRIVSNDTRYVVFNDSGGTGPSEYVAVNMSLCMAA